MTTAKIAGKLTVISNCILLIKYLAHKLRPDDFEEAFSIGLMGLTRAIQTYKEDRGAKFISYAAMLIRHDISSLTSYKQRSARYIKSIQQLYYQRTGYQLCPEQLAEFLEEDGDRIRSFLRLDNVTSLDEFKISEDGGQVNFIDENVLLPEEAGTLDKEFVAATVENVLEDLSDEDREIVSLYYGLGNLNGRSYEQAEIGQMLIPKMTRSAVGQRLKKIIERLKSNRRLKVLVEA